MHEAVLSRLSPLFLIETLENLLRLLQFLKDLWAIKGIISPPNNKHINTESHIIIKYGTNHASLQVYSGDQSMHTGTV